jgi:hypothetical protein
VEIKTLPVVNPFDMLLAEIIVTLRAGFGMKPAKYDPSMSGIEIPDDYKAKKVKEAKGKPEETEEPKAD